MLMRSYGPGGQRYGLAGTAARLERQGRRAVLERARTLAGPDGVALATGSIYLIADLLRPAGAARSTL